MVSKPGSAPVRGRTRASSTSSRPTDRRSSPSGTRSPSQRWRVSISEWTPPRLVAFVITRVEVSTRRAAAPSATSNDMSPPKPGIAHDRDGAGARRAGARARARSPSGARRGTAASGGCAAAASTGSGAATMPVSCGTRAGARRPPPACTRRRRGARRRGRRGTSSRCGATKSAPCSSGRRWIGVAAVESTTTGAGCAAAASRSGIVRNGFDGASSQTSCTSSGGAPVWSNSTTFSPQRASAVEEPAGAEVRAVGERDRRAGLEQRERERRRRAGVPDGKSNA